MQERVRRDEMPAQRQKPKEGVESPELFRASLGFDFIFALDENGQKRAYCIEVNGHDSGLGGVAEIPEGRISNRRRKAAAKRDARNPEFLRRADIAQELVDSMREGTFQASSKEVEKKIKEDYIIPNVLKVPHFSNAFQNPKWLQRITRDKSLQRNIIPDENRPRELGNHELTAKPPLYWVLKPKDGKTGHGIHILTNSEMVREFANPKVQERYVAQEWKMPLGADNAPPGQEGHPAAMRVLWDFIYREDGTIDIKFKEAYQRISPFAPDVRILPNGKPVSLEDIYVVNLARDAGAADASEDEKRLVRPVMEAIINNIAQIQREILGKD